MFVSLTDSYEKPQLAQFRKFATTHVPTDYAAAFAALQPVAVRYYVSASERGCRLPPLSDGALNTRVCGGCLRLQNDSTFAADSGQPQQPTVCYRKPAHGSVKEQVGKSMHPW